MSGGLERKKNPPDCVTNPVSVSTSNDAVTVVAFAWCVSFRAIWLSPGAVTRVSRESSVGTTLGISASRSTTASEPSSTRRTVTSMMSSKPSVSRRL